MLLQTEHRLPEEAAPLPAGGVVPQLQHLEQDLQQAVPQRLGRNGLAQQLPVLQAVRQLGRVAAQLLDEACGAEVGAQRQVLPQRRGIQGTAHVAQILLHEVFRLVGVGGFQKIAQNGGVHPGGVQRRQWSKRYSGYFRKLVIRASRLRRLASENCFSRSGLSEGVEKKARAYRSARTSSSSRWACS